MCLTCYGVGIDSIEGLQPLKVITTSTFVVLPSTAFILMHWLNIYVRFNNVLVPIMYTSNFNHVYMTSRNCVLHVSLNGNLWLHKKTFAMPIGTAVPSIL